MTVRVHVFDAARSWWGCFSSVQSARVAVRGSGLPQDGWAYQREWCYPQEDPLLEPSVYPLRPALWEDPEDADYLSR